MTFNSVAELLPGRHLFVTIPSQLVPVQTTESTWAPGESHQAPGLELFDQLSGAALIKLVLEAVHEFDLTMPVRRLAKGRTFGPEQTATLLAYCYARGVYSSEEIEGRLSVDPGVAYICAGLKPDWHMLRRFRRDNALLLLGILTRLLELIAHQLGVLRVAEAPERVRTNFRQLAMNRLHDAIQADSMAMDQ